MSSHWWHQDCFRWYQPLHYRTRHYCLAETYVAIATVAVATITAVDCYLACSFCFSRVGSGESGVAEATNTAELGCHRKDGSISSNRRDCGIRPLLS